MSGSIACVIMAGGSGERLWPLVRSRVPKVCLSINGTTLLGATIRRVRELSTQAPWIITTASQVRAIRRAVPAGGAARIIAEPQPNNTAACIALAAAAWARRDPNAILVLLPADHWIQPTAAFHRSIQAAIDVARAHDGIVALGVRPSRVHSGLGHLCAGRLLGRRRGCRVFEVDRFLEKPAPHLAQRLTRRATTFWNIGIFVGRATTLLAAIRRHLPQHAERLSALSRWVDAPAFTRRAVPVYRRLRAVSFDDGVMARLRNSVMVEAAFQWEDLGSWDSWIRIARRPRSAVTIGGRNVRVIGSDHHLVATVGLQDVIIVQTPDATLICRAQETQAVRQVVGRLMRGRGLARYW